MFTSRPRRTAILVADTSRNGLGPWPYPAGVYPEHEDWCNPPARGTGALPTTTTNVPLVDAYLWIKVPAGGPLVRRAGEGAHRARQPLAGSTDLRRRRHGHEGRRRVPCRADGQELGHRTVAGVEAGVDVRRRSARANGRRRLLLAAGRDRHRCGSATVSDAPTGQADGRRRDRQRCGISSVAVHSRWQGVHLAHRTLRPLRSDGDGEPVTVRPHVCTSARSHRTQMTGPRAEPIQFASARRRVSSPTPPRRRARMWNRLMSKSSPSRSAVSSRICSHMRWPTLYEGAWPGQPR